MSTKTMRLPPRRVLTPSGTTNKRKERDDPFERPKPIATTKNEKPNPRPGSEAITSSSNSSGGGKGVVEPAPSNHLLAGYLAHEYLTKGTLMGQSWDKLKGKSEEEEDGGGGGGGDAAAAAPCRRSTEEKYAEVAGLFKGGGGSHLPGVVNPTQLGSFLHL